MAWITRWLRAGWPFLMVLGAGLAFEFTGLDFWIQDRLFDAAAGRWWVDGNAPVGRILFYEGPKLVLAGLAFALVVLLLGPARWRAALARRGWRAQRRPLALALVGAALVPTAVGLLKDASGVSCPAELTRYGGKLPYARPFMNELCTTTPRGHCWPAGHASGGFALLALTPLAVGAGRRTWVTLLALAVGWTMGLYQIFKGAHFVSHTLVTWSLALIFTAVVGKFSDLD